MYSVVIAVEPEQYDALTAELWDAGTVGLVETSGCIEAFFADEQSAGIFGEPRLCAEVDWVQHTQDSWPPLLVGENFFIVAPWRTEPTPEGRYRLEINPGIQCGTGQHPCTRLCLEALEKAIRPGTTVLDVGSGSGILSRAAKLLGAGRVVACDIDPNASIATALRDAVSGDVAFFVGSADAVRSDAFDVVVANISEVVLGELRPELERVARRRILSGFQDEDAEWACIVNGEAL